jgi:hypothetical protein
MSTKRTPSKEDTVEPSTVEDINDVSAPDEWEFDTLVDESPTTVIFDEIGDVFVGQYKGMDHIVPDNGKDEPFDRYTFRARDGKPYAINRSYKLAEAMEKVQPDQWVRITYVKDIQTARNLNPMKDLKVEVKRES